MRTDDITAGQERLRARVLAVEQLPSSPATAGRIITAAARPQPDFNEVVDAVEADQSVSLRILRMASAASFNRSQRVDDIRQAARLLGLDNVCAVAMCVSVREGLFGKLEKGDPLVHEFWRHGLACACAAQLAARRVQPHLSGLAFAAGLVHDCGKLALLLAAPEVYPRIMRDEFLIGDRLLRAEQQVLGADHCLVGKWLLERWGLPTVFVEAVWMHHQPASGPAAPALTPVVSLVALADRLSHEAMGTLPGASRDSGTRETAHALGLEPAALDSILAELGACYAERAVLFDIQEDAAAFYFNALTRANRRLGEKTLGLIQKSTGLERDAAGLRAVALAGVDIAQARTPQDVLAAVARCIQERMGVQSGLVCMAREPGESQADGFCWEQGRPPRPVCFPMVPQPDAAPDADAPPGRFARLLPGWRTRASVLAGEEGPPVHFQDGVAIVGLLDEPQRYAEALFQPVDGAIGPRDRSCVSLLAQLAVQAFSRLALVRRCEARSERLEQMMRTMREMDGKLLKTQRLAAVGQLAAGAAHEINNPLAIVSARAQLLEMREADPAKKKGLRQMVEQIERISAILASLMDFARPAAPKMETVAPGDVLDKVLGLMESGLAKQNARVERDYQPEVPTILADSRQLEQVLLNLALNAQHAVEGRDGVLRAALSYDPRLDSVVFSIADNGVGIPTEHLDKIFDPFFTTKPEGKGTGLGLSTAYGIVKAHRGSLNVQSTPGQGTVFTVTIPRDMRTLPGSTEQEPRA